jgi:hypothetical protein
MYLLSAAFEGLQGQAANAMSDGLVDVLMKYGNLPNKWNPLNPVNIC